MAQKNNSYFNNVDKYNQQFLKQLRDELPPFLSDFFRGIDATTLVSTRVSYARDLLNFFEFLFTANPLLKDRDIKSFTLEEFAEIKPTDIEEYLEYLNIYTDKNDKTVTNGNSGRAHKLSTLRSVYHYFTSHKEIQSNPAAIVNMPKIHKKEICRLDLDEIHDFIQYMYNAENSLTGRQKAFFLKTKYRDIAIICVLLGTGIRVSELVGLDLEHIDFKHNGIFITRKGRKEQTVYFDKDVAKALKDYITLSRKLIVPVPGHENALFLSLQKKRISVDAVEKLVTKYASGISSKHITPHRLRASYGTALYEATGDLYLTADVLGHESVETTRKHYAAMTEQRRRSAAGKVNLMNKIE